VVRFLGVVAIFVCWPSFMFILGGLSLFLGSRGQSSLMVVHWRRHGGRAVVGVVVVVVGDERKPCHMVFGWWFVW